MTLAFNFHPEARAEFVADVDWYDAREVGVGGRFEVAVRGAIDAAVDSPESWAVWHGWDRQPVVRSKGVNGFPTGRIHETLALPRRRRPSPVASNGPERISAGHGGPGLECGGT